MSQRVSGQDARTKRRTESDHNGVTSELAIHKKSTFYNRTFVLERSVYYDHNVRISFIFDVDFKVRLYKRDRLIARETRVYFFLTKLIYSTFFSLVLCLVRIQIVLNSTFIRASLLKTYISSSSA